MDEMAGASLITLSSESDQERKDRIEKGLDSEDWLELDSSDIEDCCRFRVMNHKQNVAKNLQKKKLQNNFSLIFVILDNF